MSRDAGRASSEPTPARSATEERRHWRWPARVALLVLVASILPVPGSEAAGGGAEGVPVLFGLDPFVASHLLGYAVLVVCCLRALEAGGTAFSAGSRFSVLAAAVVLAAGYGAVVETLQVPIPWRSGGMIDAGINAVGAFLGVAVDSAGRWGHRFR